MGTIFPEMARHFEYVLAAYGMAVFLMVGLVIWALINQRKQESELKNLEAAGIRRRSEANKER